MATDPIGDPTADFLREIEALTSRIRIQGTDKMVDTYKMVVTSINQILAIYQLAGPEKYDPTEALSQIAQLTALVEPIENITFPGQRGGD